MNILKHSVFLMCYLFFLAHSDESLAHIMPENSARITIRDGQVEIELYVDIDRWVSQLAKIKTRESKDSSDYSSVTFSSPELQKIIQTQVVLRLDGHLLPVTLSAFPKFSEIKKHEQSEITLRAKHKVRNLENISITFPASLGDIYTNVVKPSYKTIKKGQALNIKL